MIQTPFHDRRYPKLGQNNRYNLGINTSERTIKSKQDIRSFITHTFSGTGYERINHNLGRTPEGATPINTDEHGTVVGDQAQWTNKVIYLKSDVAGATVKIQLT